MSASKPVVVYGASGFSGRLVVEYLREYNIPFIAAGRNRAKIEQVMKLVPGIETADYEVAEVGNSVDELAKLFSGAKVVCNTVGPFEDTINHRRFCGEGEFDVKGFVECIRKTGYAGPWGIEVLSEDLRRLPLDEAVSKAFKTTMDYVQT